MKTFLSADAYAKINELKENLNYNKNFQCIFSFCSRICCIRFSSINRKEKEKKKHRMHVELFFPPC